jgi:mannose-6-phosphate isomerase-like protein (cupin superfamily)
MGVSVVQRAKVEFTGVDTAIAHVSLDEIYYVLAGEGTMVTGGEFINSRSSVSALVGPILRGEIRGGVLQSVEPGDIAIIPKGMPHGWHEITTDTISYIIFRGDPDKVMSIKKEL